MNPALTDHLPNRQPPLADSDVASPRLLLTQSSPPFPSINPTSPQQASQRSNPIQSSSPPTPLHTTVPHPPPPRRRNPPQPPMGSQAIEAHRAGAEVYHGAALCAEKSTELLAEVHLPLGLLPLADMEEVGYNRSTGFVWLRQKKSLTHTFKQIGRPVSYATEVTAFVEDRKMKRMTGVKTKELLIWVTLSDMFIDKDDQSKITFKTPTGLGRTFPVAAFAKEGTADAAAADKPKDAPATAAAATVSK